MKITKSKTTASSNLARIPVPFDQYYRVASDAEVNDFTGYYPELGEKSPCEEAQGYNIKHIAWAMAKDEYLDALADDGIDIVELVTSDWDNSNPMLAYVVKDRVYPLDIDEVTNCLEGIGHGVKLSTDIKASAQIAIPQPFNKYYKLITDEQLASETGYEDEDGISPCEAMPGYDIKHISWVKARPEYFDLLADNGLEYVELVNEDGHIFLGYTVGDRVYSVDINEVENCILGSADITASYIDDEQFFADDWVSGIAAKFSVPDDIAEEIYEFYNDQLLAQDSFDNVRSFLEYVEDHIVADINGDPLINGLHPTYDKYKWADALEKGYGFENIINSSTDITAATWMGKYRTVNGELKKVYFTCEGCGFEDAEKYFEDIIPEAYTSAKLLGTAPAPALLEKDGFVSIDSCNSIQGAIDTGLEYWYYTKHGLGPGMMPNDVQILDWYEDDHWNTWFKVDKLLTTQE